MSSDGLHLFMDAICAREKSKKESSESGGDLATVIKIVKLAKPNRTAESPQIAPDQLGAAGPAPQQLPAGNQLEPKHRLQTIRPQSVSD